MDKLVPACAGIAPLWSWFVVSRRLRAVRGEKEDNFSNRCEPPAHGDTQE